MKIQRKHEDYLEPYRRHAAACKVKSRTEMAKCDCPIWAYGRIKAQMQRLSLGTRSQSTAGRVMDRLLHPAKEPESGEIADRANEDDGVSIARAREAFLASRRVKECSERTIELYDRTLDPFQKFCEANAVLGLGMVTPELVTAFMQSRAHKWGSRTKVGQLTNLRIFFAFAVARKWITESPAAKEKVPSPKRVKKFAREPFTPEQIAKILAAFDQVPEIRRKQVRAFVLLLLYSGQRISDATMLLRSGVDMRTRMLTFEVIKTHRDNTPIELHPSVIAALKALPVMGSHFFISENEAGSMLRAVAKTKKWVAQALALAGVKGSAHVFRDTFAISLLTAGVDIFTVSKLLGHSDVRVTQDHYLNFIPGYFERMSQSTRKLDFARVA